MTNTTKHKEQQQVQSDLVRLIRVKTKRLIKIRLQIKKQG